VWSAVGIASSTGLSGGYSWYALAERFTDEWDQAAFDPTYSVLPLEEFEPLVRQILGKFPMGK
jgi:hypothetical protein